MSKITFQFGNNLPLEKIKFTNETYCKYFGFKTLQFFANGTNKEGYRLQVEEFYHIPDQYQLNRFCSRHYKTNFARESVNLDTIRKQILEVIENYDFPTDIKYI